MTALEWASVSSESKGYENEEAASARAPFECRRVPITYVTSCCAWAGPPAPLKGDERGYTVAYTHWIHAPEPDQCPDEPPAGRYDHRP